MGAVTTKQGDGKKVAAEFPLSKRRQPEVT
jgi:hypothetical protein